MWGGGGVWNFRKLLWDEEMGGDKWRTVGGIGRGRRTCMLPGTTSIIGLLHIVGIREKKPFKFLTQDVSYSSMLSYCR